MTKQLTKYAPDTLEHLQSSDLVQLSRDLLGSVVEQTRVMDRRVKVTPDRLQELRVVLGYLNSAVSASRAKMQFFKLVGLDEKIKAVKKSRSMVE